MPAVDIRPATHDRFDDAQRALSGGGDGRSCQCQWWTLTNAQFQHASADDRRELLRAELDDDLAPALIACVDGEAAGWVRVGPRTRQARLSRTRQLVAATREPWDDPTVWAVSCFVVRAEHRGAGITDRLLAAAIDFARAHGARVLEGYPVDPAAGGKRVNELYHGVVSTFERAGFREIARPKPDRAVCALELA